MTGYSDGLLGYFSGELDTLLTAIDRADFSGAILVLDGDPSPELEVPDIGYNEVWMHKAVEDTRRAAFVDALGDDLRRAS